MAKHADTRGNGVPKDDREPVDDPTAVPNLAEEIAKPIIWYRRAAQALSPERVFVLFTLGFGLLFTFLTPPFQVADEPNHFQRAYQLSESGPFAQRMADQVGANLPQSLEDVHNLCNRDGVQFHRNQPQDPRLLSEAWQMPLNPSTRTFQEFPNTAIVPPMAYFPQSTGILFGRLCGLRPLTLLTLGRLCNLLFWTLLVFMSIRAIPVGKWILCSLALTPMAVFQAASLSGDTPTNGFGILLLSLILRAAIVKETDPGLEVPRNQPATQRNWLVSSKRAHTEITLLLKGELIALVVVTILLALCKQSYFMLSLLVFLIPTARFASRRKHARFVGIFLLATALTTASWLFAIHQLNLYTPLQPKVSPGAQLLYVLRHPLAFGISMFISYVGQFFGLMGEYLGNLGWLDTPLPDSLYPIYIVALLAIAVTDFSGNGRLRGSQRFLTLLVVCLCFVAVSIMIYMSWTEVGASVIKGLQGRYFIPFVPLIPIALFTQRRLNIREPNLILNVARTLVFAFVLITTTALIVARYYGIFYQWFFFG